MGYKSFQVKLENCTFIKGTNIIELPYSTQRLEFDHEKNQDHRLEVVSIKVKKRIGDREFDFYSPQYSHSADDLRIRVGFFSSIVVHYNEQDPSEYHFEIKV